MYPKSAVVHYQLGNTYVQLHRRLEAKEEYSRCLSGMPDATTANYCRKMLESLGGSHTSTVSPEVQNVKTQSSGSSSAADNNQRQRDEIITKAEREAAAVRADAERQIKDLTENSQQTITDPETGQRKLGIQPGQVDAIRSEAEERAKRIMQEAKDRASHL